MGKETHEQQPDQKETYDVGNEDEEYRNKWPTEELGENFRSDLLAYFDAFDALHIRIMRLLAVGMKLTDEDFFVNRCNQRHENMRLLHYPSIQANGDLEETIVRGSVHTDFGTITLLTQDSVGGLRAQKLNGEWVNVPPVANSVVVNIGDMLQRWSNDTLRATPHQVVQLLQQGNTCVIPERYSIAFFCNANKDVMLECLEQCKSEERPARFPPIKAHDYLTLRLSQTISKEVSI
jgi:isopenicillin N synthase-like dioxygenase